MSNLIYSGKDWNWDKIQRVYDECEKIAVDELKLTYYQNVIELITFEQMLDAYSSIGMPVMYNHWSFGKDYEKNYEQYRTGRMGLALEIVINSSPCINYLMEENSMTSQSLVIAHAAFGHNSFFKNNYLFKQWTQADTIIDYLLFAKRFVSECEDKYGSVAVEETLDAAHALQNHAVDRYPKPKQLSLTEEISRQKDRDEDYERSYNEYWQLVESKKKNRFKLVDKFLPHGPEENLLYFLEKKSPVLESWQRELLRIVRKMAQYFYPQGQTKTANEGWATTVHYYIMNRLHEKELIDDGSAMEFLDLHCAVIAQPSFKSKNYYGFNPYALGHSLFMDIKRISENPTEEDKYWFPDYAGGDWLENWHHAYQNYRDDSLIQQFLSPKLIRDLRLFSLNSEFGDDEYTVDSISNERGYRKIRNRLAEQHSVTERLQDVQITGVDFESRVCYLTHYSDRTEMLEEEDCVRTLKYFQQLWGFPVVLQSRDRSTLDLLDEYEMNT